GVLLTFDDGPHPEHTPAVLDRLAAFGLRATFFLVGDRICDPALVRRITGEGHTLGNHTFAHAVPRWTELGAARDEVAKCQALVPTAKVLRAPFGKLTPGLWLAARHLRLECVHWSLDSGDWQCRSEPDALRCAREVIELVRPGDILLFHDNHRWSRTILDSVLPELARRRLL
ncbi:MAG: polysaccharide deacetylase family protein, partial [Gemmata sp.]